mgnify:CR=1 FL=1
MLSAEQIWGVIRTILAAVAGYFAGKGLFDMGMANDVISALGVIFVAVWSVVSKPKTTA